ncbi:MAG: carbon-nitrogen hydrolase family protein [Methanobacteriaceae archaeon]
MKKFQIALCQMKVGPDKAQNIKNAVRLIKEAGKKVDLVVLPEMFNCPYQTDQFPLYAEVAEESPTLEAVSQAARKAKVYLVAGSIPEREEGRIYNTSFIYNPDGELIGRHRKMHLFDIDVPGQIQFKESETLTPGDEVTVVDTDFGKIGVAICYDMRFPELSRLMTLQGAELLVFPGAFNLTTGPAHWEILSRVRALDNQVYLAACSPARDVKASYVAYGHSLVADPWGEVLVQAGTGEEIIYAGIEGSYLQKVRQELPLLKNRRKDLYNVDFKK